MSQHIIEIDEMARFMAKSLIAAGADPQHAAQHAALLVTADYRGHFSHGLNRLELYMDELKSQTARGEGTPIILKENLATAWVDGNNLLGAVVGNFCMELAIKKAKDVGIGFVNVKGSNHYGIAGYYSLLALKHNLLGLSFTNATPIVVPTRAKNPSVGTNPISLATPGLNGDTFVLDMATSSVTLGKLQLAHTNNQPIPEGWAIDKDGEPLNNFPDFHALLPLGGRNKPGGFGLSMMVEIFCGVLSGGHYGPTIREHRTSDLPMNLSHCFIAINPEFFSPGFSERMQDLIDDCRKQEPGDGQQNVIIAGDPERAHMKLCDELGGIPYQINQINIAFRIADKLKLDRPKVTCTK